MYIAELFIKIKEDFNDKKGPIYNLFLKFEKFILKLKKIEIPQNTNEEIEDDSTNCSHIFVPVDSTGKVLACTKCGEIYKPTKKDTNPF